MRLHFYAADHDGWRVLVTPRPMMQNSDGLVELTDAQLNAPPYASVRQDAEAFFRQAGAGAAVLLYDTQSRIAGEGADLIGSLWLRGPLAGDSSS